MNRMYLKSLIHYATMLLLVTGSMACSKPDLPQDPGNSPPASIDYRYPVNLILDSLSLAAMRKAVAAEGPMASAYNSIVAQPAASALAKAPQPAASVSSDNFSNISSQASDCKVLAVHWLYLYNHNPAGAKPYFDKVVNTLQAWVNAGNAATNHLPNETAYLGFYEAYSAIRSRMSAADRTRIDNWISSRALVYRNFAPRVNNWETIRLNFLYYIGYLLGSKELIAYTEGAYTTLLNVNLLAGGKSEDLVDRDAFAYHAYNLSFYARILRAKSCFEGAQAMEMFRARRNNINVSLQDMMSYWKPFLLDPVANVHIEFVNTNYAPDKQRSDYNKPYQPSSAVYALEELLLAFPETKEFIEVITGGNRYNRKLSGFLYWP